MTIGDVYADLNALQTGTSTLGKPFKQNTKQDYVQVLRSFCLWLIANKYSTIPEEKIRAIRTPPVDHNTTAPEALLSAEEIKALLTGCRSARDRAIVAVLYESGARIGFYLVLFIITVQELLKSSFFLLFVVLAATDGPKALEGLGYRPAGSRNFLVRFDPHTPLEYPKGSGREHARPRGLRMRAYRCMPSAPPATTVA
jgi:hypothetical protein